MTLNMTVLRSCEGVTEPVFDKKKNSNSHRNHIRNKQCFQATQQETQLQHLKFSSLNQPITKPMSKIEPSTKYDSNSECFIVEIEISSETNNTFNQLMSKTKDQSQHICLKPQQHHIRNALAPHFAPHWHHNRTSLASHRRHIGTLLASYWHPIGNTLAPHFAPHWHHISTALTPGSHPISTPLPTHWHPLGTPLAPPWHPIGTTLALH